MYLPWPSRRRDRKATGIYTQQESHSSPAVVPVTLLEASPAPQPTSTQLADNNLPPLAAVGDGGTVPRDQAPTAHNSLARPEVSTHDDDKNIRKDSGACVPELVAAEEFYRQSLDHVTSASAKVDPVGEEGSPGQCDEDEKGPGCLPTALSSASPLAPAPAPALVTVPASTMATLTPHRHTTCHGTRVRWRSRSLPDLRTAMSSPGPWQQPGQPASACALAAGFVAWQQARRGLCCLRAVGGRRSPVLRRWLALDWATGFRPLVAAANELGQVLGHYRASHAGLAQAAAVMDGERDGQVEEEEDAEDALDGAARDALLRILCGATDILHEVIEAVLKQGTSVNQYVRWENLIASLGGHTAELEGWTAQLRELLGGHDIAIETSLAVVAASGALGGGSEEESDGNMGENDKGPWSFRKVKTRWKMAMKKKPAWVIDMRVSLEREVLGMSGTPVLAMLEYQLLKKRFRHVATALPATTWAVDDGGDGVGYSPLLAHENGTQGLMREEQWQREAADRKTIHKLETAVMAYRRFQARHTRRSNNTYVALLCIKATTAIRSYEYQLKTILQPDEGSSSSNLPMPLVSVGDQSLGGQGEEEVLEPGETVAAAAAATTAAAASPDIDSIAVRETGAPALQNSHGSDQISCGNFNTDCAAAATAAAAPPPPPPPPSSRDISVQAQTRVKVEERVEEEGDEQETSIPDATGIDCSEREQKGEREYVELDTEDDSIHAQDNAEHGVPGALIMTRIGRAVRFGRRRGLRSLLPPIPRNCIGFAARLRASDSRVTNREG